MRPKQMYPTLVVPCPCGQADWFVEAAYQRTGEWTVTPDVMKGRDHAGGTLVGAIWTCRACGQVADSRYSPSLDLALAEGLRLDPPQFVEDDAEDEG